MGGVEAEFVVVYVLSHFHILTNPISLIRTGSSQLYLLWSNNGLVGLRFSCSRNDMSRVMRGVWWTSASGYVREIGVPGAGPDTLGSGPLTSGYFLSWVSHA